MTVSALNALALRDCLRRDDSPLARRYFRRSAMHVRVPWQMNASADRPHIQVHESTPLHTPPHRQLHRTGSNGMRNRSACHQPIPPRQLPDRSPAKADALQISLPCRGDRNTPETNSSTGQPKNRASHPADQHRRTTVAVRSCRLRPPMSERRCRTHTRSGAERLRRRRLERDDGGSALRSDRRADGSNTDARLVSAREASGSATATLVIVKAMSGVAI